LLLLHDKFFFYIYYFESSNANDSSFDLSLQFNGYPIAEAKAELQKNCCFYGYRKENFIESKKKEIVAFHLNNNPFINSWLVKSVNNWNDLPVLTKKIYSNP
jgi:phenylacetate-CoA ligase